MLKYFSKYLINSPKIYTKSNNSKSDLNLYVPWSLIFNQALMRVILLLSITFPIDNDPIFYVSNKENSYKVRFY